MYSRLAKDCPALEDDILYTSNPADESRLVGFEVERNEGNEGFAGPAPQTLKNVFPFHVILWK
jgi:hypothetical protein